MFLHFLESLMDINVELGGFINKHTLDVYVSFLLSSNKYSYQFVEPKHDFKELHFEVRELTPLFIERDIKPHHARKQKRYF